MGRHRQDYSQNFWLKNRDNIPTGLRLTYNQGVYESVTHESACMKVSSIRVSHMEVSHIKVPHMKVKVSHMEVPLVDIIKKIKILDGNARLNTFLHTLFEFFILQILGYILKMLPVFTFSKIGSSTQEIKDIKQ